MENGNIMTAIKEKARNMAAFAACAALLLPAVASANSVDGYAPVRIMTYNVAYCNHATNDVQTSTQGYALTAERVRAEAPDFLCLNEVSFAYSSYDGGRNQAELIAAATGMKVAGSSQAFSGKGGNAILANEEPISSETIRLKMAPSPVGWGDRFCTICEFTNFCVAVTHLDTTRDGPAEEVLSSNAVAIATIRAKLDEYSKPAFLCGDWNTRPNWDNMERFREYLEILSPTNGVRTYTGNAATGGYILDYIAIGKDDADRIFVTETHVTEDILTSDHNPVVVDFYLRPETGELEWIEENAIAAGMTGAWTKRLEYDGATLRAPIAGGNAFAPFAASRGRRVTVTLKTAFPATPEDDSPPTDAQTAVRLGESGSFQLWVGSAGNVANVEVLPIANSNSELENGTGNIGNLQQSQGSWIDVSAAGVVPEPWREYELRFVFDYRNKTVSAAILDEDTGEYSPLASTATGATEFPLASDAKRLAQIDFDGDTDFASLLGEDSDILHPTVFMLQ